MNELLDIPIIGQVVSVVIVMAVVWYMWGNTR